MSDDTNAWRKLYYSQRKTRDAEQANAWKSVKTYFWLVPLFIGIFLYTLCFVPLTHRQMCEYAPFGLFWVVLYSFGLGYTLARAGK